MTQETNTTYSANAAPTFSYSSDDVLNSPTYEQRSIFSPLTIEDEEVITLYTDPPPIPLIESNDPIILSMKLTGGRSITKDIRQDVSKAINKFKDISIAERFTNFLDGNNPMSRTVTEYYNLDASHLNIGHMIDKTNRIAEMAAQSLKLKHAKEYISHSIQGNTANRVASGYVMFSKTESMSIVAMILQHGELPVMGPKDPWMARYSAQSAFLHPWSEEIRIIATVLASRCAVDRVRSDARCLILIRHFILALHLDQMESATKILEEAAILMRNEALVDKLLLMREDLVTAHLINVVRRLIPSRTIPDDKASISSSIAETIGKYENVQGLVQNIPMTDNAVFAAVCCYDAFKGIERIWPEDGPCGIDFTGEYIEPLENYDSVCYQRFLECWELINHVEPVVPKCVTDLLSIIPNNVDRIFDTTTTTRSSSAVWRELLHIFYELRNMDIFFESPDCGVIDLRCIARVVHADMFIMLTEQQLSYPVQVEFAKAMRMTSFAPLLPFNGHEQVGVPLYAGCVNPIAASILGVHGESMFLRVSGDNLTPEMLIGSSLLSTRSPCGEMNTADGMFYIQKSLQVFGAVSPTTINLIDIMHVNHVNDVLVLRYAEIFASMKPDIVVLHSWINLSALTAAALLGIPVAWELYENELRTKFARLREEYIAYHWKMTELIEKCEVFPYRASLSEGSKRDKIRSYNATIEMNLKHRAELRRKYEPERIQYKSKLDTLRSQLISLIRYGCALVYQKRQAAIQLTALNAVRPVTLGDDKYNGKGAHLLTVFPEHGSLNGFRIGTKDSASANISTTFIKTAATETSDHTIETVEVYSMLRSDDDHVAPLGMMKGLENFKILDKNGSVVDEIDLRTADMTPLLCVGYSRDHIRATAESNKEHYEMCISSMQRRMNNRSIGMVFIHDLMSQQSPDLINKYISMTSDWCGGIWITPKDYREKMNFIGLFLPTKMRMDRMQTGSGLHRSICQTVSKKAITAFFERRRFIQNTHNVRKPLHYIKLSDYKAGDYY